MARAELPTGRIKPFVGFLCLPFIGSTCARVGAAIEFDIRAMRVRYANKPVTQGANTSSLTRWVIAIIYSFYL